MSLEQSLNQMRGSWGTDDPDMNSVLAYTNACKLNKFVTTKVKVYLNVQL